MILLFFYHIYSIEYHNGDEIVAYLSSIGNQDKTASAYKPKILSFIKNNKILAQIKPKTTIYDSILGSKLKDIGIHGKYQENSHNLKAISGTITEQDIKTYKDAIKNGHVYKFNIDDLDRFTLIGEIISDSVHIYTHFDVYLLASGSNIIDARINSSSLTKIEVGNSIQFEYSFSFGETAISFKNRLSRLYDFGFFENRLHFYSIVCNAIQALLIVAIVVSIYIEMIADSEKNTETDFDEFDFQITADKGWRLMHGDVFRPPQNSQFITIFVSVGAHIALSFVVFAMHFYFEGVQQERESVIKAFTYSYIITTIISGFIATALASSLQLRHWLQTVIGEATLPVTFITAFAILVGIILQPSGTAFLSSPKNSLIIATVVIIPSTLLAVGGALFARYKRVFDSSPAEIALVPRTVPRQPWYLRMPFLCASTGLVLAAAVLPEVFYASTAIWQGKVFFTYGYLLAAAATVILASSSAGVTITYFRLQAENYRWQWASFAAPAAVGIYVFAYCIVFYVTKLGGGSEALILYLAWSIVVSSAIGLACGGVSYLCANSFVRTVFSNLKLD